MPKDKVRTPKTVPIDLDVLEDLVHTQAEGFTLREVASEIWPDAAWADRDGVNWGMPSPAMFLWAALERLVQEKRLIVGLPGKDVDSLASLRFLPVKSVVPPPAKPPQKPDSDGRRRAILPGERVSHRPGHV